MAHFLPYSVTARVSNKIPAMSWSSAAGGGQFGTKHVVIEYLLRSGQHVDFIWGLFREPACTAVFRGMYNTWCEIRTKWYFVVYERKWRMINIPKYFVRSMHHTACSLMTGAEDRWDEDTHTAALLRSTVSKTSCFRTWGAPQTTALMWRRTAFWCLTKVDSSIRFWSLYLDLQDADHPVKLLNRPAKYREH